MKWLVSFALLLCCSPIAAQERGAGPLTVNVFSTRQLRHITASPLNRLDWIRTCAGCDHKPITAPLHFEVAGGSVQLNGKRRSHVEFGGLIRVGNEDGRIVADGIWRIRRRNGRLQLLLTIDSERYVALALAGEAAPDEPIESLKAMAVAVRTYAFENLNRHAKEGFNLCDSTHCQALRYGRAAQAIQQAVLDTAGETLWYVGRQAKVFYTQNCGGMTEAASNVWPGIHEPYLIAHRDPYCMRHGPARWSANIPIAKLEAIFRKQRWDVPGVIESVRIVRRTPSGRAVLLEFQGDGRHALISGSSLRFAIDRSMGWNQLRSDWYTVSLEGEALHFSGRGYGHGVGLCQAGAMEMAKEGKSYRDILSFYFPDTHVGIGPTDSGWHANREQGWHWIFVSEHRELCHRAATEWAAAQRIFPPRTPVKPTVRLFPTTELFRESTGEPGWVLASTRGTDISLQPAILLARSGEENKTLLHEFLHVLVEREAAPSTPLWLREGLVEALSHPDARHISVNMRTYGLDAALSHPASCRQALVAHKEAEARVRALIDAYGMEQVRGWLQTGVPAQALQRISTHAQ
ncbi:MAG TPA: SpoIID/LytB domain-containing protein [Acidobacteriaceae bacterium]|nr:SpoIID/LytB domain-containing protein [Acidobacteriaceae bacterium]